MFQIDSPMGGKQGSKGLCAGYGAGLLDSLFQHKLGLHCPYFGVLSLAQGPE